MKELILQEFEPGNIVIGDIDGIYIVPGNVVIRKINAKNKVL